MRYKFLILIAVFALACTSIKTIKPDIENVTYRDLLQRNVQWQESINALEGQVRITIDSPQYSGNFSADVFMNGSDSMLIAITGPFGISVGKVFIAERRFIFYNQVMNQFFTGVKSDFENKNFLQFPITLTELSDIVVAKDRFDILKKESFTVKDNAYYLEAVNGKNRYHIWYDARLKLISKIEYYVNGGLQYYKEYDQFSEYNGIYFPKVIRLVRPVEKQGLSLYFMDLAINQPLSEKSFKITVSDNATQIDLTMDN